MRDDWALNQQRCQEAQDIINDITRERELKGNGNVTARRYGELVANMVKYSEARLALDYKNKTVLDQRPKIGSLPSQQHIEPEQMRGQNAMNPS